MRRGHGAFPGLAPPGKFKEIIVSEDPNHAPQTRGGKAKWLLGGAAAIVVLGGGYLAWQNFGPVQDDTQVAYSDPYEAEPLRARPLEPNQDALTQSAARDASAPLPASVETRAPTPAPRTPARATASVPEETIGITPTSATTQDSDEIVVTAPRRPTWVRRPSARRLSALYPARALERGREGEASLHCTVRNGGALDCARASETAGGFGAAALRVARTFRHAPTLGDGSDAVGTPVNLRVVFKIEEAQRRWRS